MKTLLRRIGMGCTLVGLPLALLYGRYLLEEKREREETVSARELYAQVVGLADIDQDGNLSGLERTLLLERINNNMGKIDGVPLPKWSALQEPTRWDVYALRKTKELYEQ